MPMVLFNMFFFSPLLYLVLEAFQIHIQFLAKSIEGLMYFRVSLFLEAQYLLIICATIALVLVSPTRLKFDMCMQ